MTSHPHDPGEPHPAEGHAANGEDLAALLARLLEETGKTQKDLAEASGVKYPTLNAWITRTRGTSRVDPEQLRALADSLRGWGGSVTPKQIFESAGRPVPGPSDAEREARLLKIYRGLSARQQRSLLGIAEEMASSSRA
ncbi:helix-turn-helix transcriptional regulator [Streptomyces sp. NPDC052225]|uniref:helix-turn-helix domain-containing protein n=1 Tax=Streptomyces sp. NPDC052225 TaxID=3154949 RepID=UPI00342E92D9